MDKSYILKRAATPEDKILMARILDKINAAIDNFYTVVTDFCDPYQQTVLTPVLAKVPGISFMWTGGYDEAERRRLVIIPEHLKFNEGEAGLTVLRLTGRTQFANLTHRDFLGAVLALGIKREKIGDIIVTPEGCQIIVDQAVAGYIAAQLTKVGRLAVKVEEGPIESLAVPDKTVKEIFATVPSLRLDAVAAVGFGVSRSKLTAEILGEKVKVNWLAITDCSFPIKEGDVLSIRGRGRVEVGLVKGKTKKDRISLTLKRYQ